MPKGDGLVRMKATGEIKRVKPKLKFQPKKRGNKYV